MTFKTMCAGLLILMLMLFPLLTSAANQQSVAIKQATVRAKPAVFAPKLTTLSYGEQVTVTGDERAWFKVRLADGRSGWMQKSALTTEKLQLRAGDQQVSASASEKELTLAGKGFNNEVEQEFRQRNRGLDYTWIDRMEGFNPEDSELQHFLRSGQLNATGGDDAR